VPVHPDFSYNQTCMQNGIGQETPERIRMAPPPKRFRIPPAIQNVLKFAVGGGAIWFLIHSGALDPASIGEAFVRNPWLCVIAFFTYLIPVLLAAWVRWHLCMRNAGLKVPAGRSLSLHMIGIFFNSLIPGNGGDLIKGYYLFQDHDEGDRALALTSIAMDRLVGTYGLLCMGMAMTWVNYGLWSGSPALRVNSFFYAGVFIAFTALIIFFFSPYSTRVLAHRSMGRLPGGRFLKSLSDSLLVYRRRPKGLFLVLGVGFIVDCGLILLYYFFARALGLNVPLMVHGFVVPTMTMINGVPISPSGVGVGEAVGEVIYRNVGVAEGGSEILAMVHICILVTSLLGAPFYFFIRARSGKDSRQA
jgi:uncharacterized protein (TIRG00374 family)